MMYDLIGNVGWVLGKRFKTGVGNKKWFCVYVHL